MVLDTTKHYPVLLNELISIITPQHGGTFIDCTFGQGGYSKKILRYKIKYSCKGGGSTRQPYQLRDFKYLNIELGG